jgi:hypothetical protein
VPQRCGEECDVYSLWYVGYGNSREGRTLILIIEKVD